jgi:hypothetical protein
VRLAEDMHRYDLSLPAAPLHILDVRSDLPANLSGPGAHSNGPLFVARNFLCILRALVF